MSISKKYLPTLVGAACGAFAMAAMAAPANFNIDSGHTYPSFQTDHGGMSMFTGKINRTTGTIVLDREAGTGTVDITMDMKTIDFGNDQLNNHVMTDPNMLDTANHPTAKYTGKLVGFKDGSPTAVEGTLTLRGVSKPVNLTLTSFKCADGRGGHTCGANATGTFERSDFGVAYGGAAFDMTVTLMIQIEARRT